MKTKGSAQKIQQAWRFNHQRKTNKKEWKPYSPYSPFRCPRLKMAWQLLSSFNSFLVRHRNSTRFRLAVAPGSSLCPTALKFPFFLSVFSYPVQLSITLFDSLASALGFFPPPSSLSLSSSRQHSLGFLSVSFLCFCFLSPLVPLAAASPF